MYDKAKILTSGDSAVTLELGNIIDHGIFIKIKQISMIIESEKIDWIREYMPTFRSILIHYDPIMINFNDLKDEIYEIIDRSNLVTKIKSRKYYVPVLFNKEYGPDLENVAKTHNLTIGQVVEIFTKETYLNYFTGFMPGLPNMSLPAILHTPRLKTPRLKVNAGSVGFGGKQACIYPLTSAGGHNLVGRTPLRLFDNKKLIQTNKIEEAIIFKTGDYLKFVKINENEFNKIAKDIEQDKFTVEYEKIEEEVV